MALGMPRVETTISVDTQLGRRCLMMMRQLLPPERMQLWMYSEPFRRMTSPRTSLAVEHHIRRPNATYRLMRPGPSTYMTTMANSRNGKDEKTWITNEMTASTLPPK